MMKIQKTVEFVHEKKKQGFGPAFEWIANNSHCSNFARSLNEQLSRNSFLSDKQLQAAMTNTKPMRVDTRSDNFQKLFAAFAKAQKGAKRPPIFRAGVEGDAHGIRLNMAGPNAKPANQGCLYVLEDAPYDERAYLGKITPGGEYRPSYAATDLHRKAVDLVADDPWQAALTYGRAMGRCSCCGRTLTAGKSIEDGIGPICKDKWGL